MKVEIHNLGVIEQAEIDLKPLTIFVGPNNTGKTWAAYTLSAIFGRSGWESHREGYAISEALEAYPPLDAAIQQVLEEGNAQIDLAQFADEYGEKYFNDVARLIRNRMRSFLNTERVSFEDLEVRVRLEETKERFLERVKDSSAEAKFSAGQQRDVALFNIFKERGEPTLYFYTTAERSMPAKLPLRAVKGFLAWGIFMVLHRALYYDVYPFPTERTTFITFPFTLKTSTETEKDALKTNEVSQQEQRGRPLAEPVSDFLDMMVNAFLTSPSAREEEAENTPRILNYIQLSKLLERILGGDVDFSTPEPRPRRQLLFQPAEDVALDMPVVSSMVKELSPLVLYLRYLAQPGEWLVIDEPEMNLHPEAQVRFTEFLAMLVHFGLHVLVTTHSPYVVDHLINLMKAAEHEDKEGVREKFYLQRTEALIPKEQVSVYLFEDGTAKNILDEEGRIDWGTFGRVSDRVSQIYFEL